MSHDAQSLSRETRDVTGLPVHDEDRPVSRSERGVEAESNPMRSQRPFYRRPWIMAALVCVLIVASVGATLYVRHARTYESTDDAYVDVVYEHVSSRVAGQVSRVLVDDNQDVRAGQPLVELDPTDFQNALAQAEFDASRAEAEVEQARAGQALATAQLAQSSASVDAARANAARAADDLRRDGTLEHAGALSQQQLVGAQTTAKDSDAQLVAARKTVSAAAAQVHEAERQIQAAQAAVQSARARVELSRRNLSYTEIRASLAGRVAMKRVAPGDYVQPGTQLMVVVPRELYVTANFKETQLASMRPGQATEVVVDAYPDMKLRGHVDSVQPGSGQAFDVLPPENATGNWVKIVQRVPVKIVFDHLPDSPWRRLGPGMSAEVSVKVR